MYDPPLIITKLKHLLAGFPSLTEFPDDVREPSRPPPHAEGVMCTRRGTELLQQVVIFLAATRDLDVQLGLVTRPDSEPSFKGEQEVVRLSLAYHQEHMGPETQYAGYPNDYVHFVLGCFHLLLGICQTFPLS